MSKEMKEIKLYTDGACSGNPGPGGWGALLIYNGHEKELSGGYRDTTNNRMEILAVIRGLEALKERCKVSVYSDSKYVVDAINQGWAVRWKKKGWMRNKKDRAKNVDLWKRLLELLNKHEVEFSWVKGHAGHPENERADDLATSALKAPDLPVDPGDQPNTKSLF